MKGISDMKKRVGVKKSVERIMRGLTHHTPANSGMSALPPLFGRRGSFSTPDRGFFREVKMSDIDGIRELISLIDGARKKGAR